MRSVRRHLKDEQGSMVVWMAVLCSVCMVVSISVGRIGNATRSVSLAQNAADAAALSAAYEIAHSNSAQACSSAKIASLRNEAKAIRCEYTNDWVEVEVRMLNQPDIFAKARAEIQ